MTDCDLFKDEWCRKRLMKNWPKPCLTVWSNPVNIKVCRNPLQVVLFSTVMVSRGLSSAASRLQVLEVTQVKQNQFSFHYTAICIVNISLSLISKGHEYAGSLNPEFPYVLGETARQISGVGGWSHVDHLYFIIPFPSLIPIPKTRELRHRLT